MARVIAELRLAMRTVDVPGVLAGHERLLAWETEERQRISDKKGG